MRSFENGLLVRAYMEARGVSKRTAWRHREKQTPEWLAFVRARAAEQVRVGIVEQAASGVVSDCVPSPRELAAGLQAAGESVERLMERAALESWRAVKLVQLDAIARRDLVVLSGAGRAEIAAQDAYVKAKGARIEAELAAGQLIDRGQLAGVIAAIGRLGSLLAHCPAEIGAKALPSDPLMGAEVVKDWLRERVNPGLRAVVEAVRVTDKLAEGEGDISEATGLELPNGEGLLGGEDPKEKLREARDSQKSSG